MGKHNRTGGVNSLSAQDIAAAAARFWIKVDRSDEQGCWPYTAGLDKNGYGIFSVKKITVRAHRYAYQLLIGPIPKDRVLDHRITCPKRCVNPAHLRPVTHKQNMENRQRKTKTRSGIRGVLWNKNANRWLAQVVHNRKTYRLGLFDTIEAAEAAAVAKRRELFTHSDIDNL